MDRREYIKAAGAVGAAGVIGAIALSSRDNAPDPSTNGTTTTATTTTTTSGTPIPYAEDFGNVIDVVDAGFDPKGVTPINSQLNDMIGDDTLFAFPPGRYSIAGGTLSGFDHLGFVAVGDGEHSFVAADGGCVDSGAFFSMRNLEGLLIEGMDFDFRGQQEGGPIHLRTDGNAVLRDVQLLGSCPDQISQLRVDVLDPRNEVVFERLRAINTEENPTLTGVFVGSEHSGTVTFRDCELLGFSDNGLYASAPGLPDGKDGLVVVEGGRYQNNNVSNIRLGSTGSRARGVKIVAEEAPAADSINVRGIRFRNRSGQIVEDSSIHIGANAGSGFGAIVFHQENDGATIRNTDVVVNQDGYPAITAHPNENAEETAPVFENVTISGNANGGFIGLIQERDRTTFRGCTIEGTGSDRSGLRFSFSDGCLIEDCRIDVTGDPIVLRQSTATIRNTTLVTPDGEQYIESMDAGDGDITPR